MPRMTRTEKLARRRLIYHLWLAEEDELPLAWMRAELPEAWHTIEADIDCMEPKRKVTLYLDASVTKMFRSMGQERRSQWVAATHALKRSAGVS